MDFIRVNIYNRGYIKWLNTYGPLCGENLGVGVYGILKQDPSIDMEVVTPSNAKEKMQEHFNKQQPAQPKPAMNIPAEPVQETINFEKAMPEKKVEADPVIDDIDAKIDAAIESLPATVTPVHVKKASKPRHYTKRPGRVAEPYITPDPKHKYTDEELSKLRAKELASILTARGFLSSGQKLVKGHPMAPHMNDNKETLIKKIKKTQ